MLALFFWGILGLVVGSFIGAYTYRYPRGISIAKGRSFCPKCKKKISWFDNIPIGSFLFLKGKCRRCGKKISLRYPLIELAGAIGFVIFAPNIFLIFVFSVLLAIFVIDLEEKIIPDELVFAGVFAAFLVFLLTDFNFYASLLAGLGAAGLLLLINLVTRGYGMGLGDVKLALFLGMLLAPTEAMLWLLVSFLFGGAVGFSLLILGKARLKQKIAFGPFLISAFFVVLIWGGVIKKWILL